MHCPFCDTSYAISTHAGEFKTEKEVATAVKDLLPFDTQHEDNGMILVLSGGEPLLQVDELSIVLEQIQEFWNPDLVVWETNGSLLRSNQEKVVEALAGLDFGSNKGDNMGQFFVVSPKPCQMITDVKDYESVGTQIATMANTVNQITSVPMELKLLISEINPFYSFEFWKGVLEYLGEYRDLIDSLVSNITVQPLLVPGAGVEITRKMYDDLLIGGRIYEWPEWVWPYIRVIPQVHQLLGYGRGV